MATRIRAVPLTYAELVAAIQDGIYPHERTWLDFKRRLYPENGDSTGPRQGEPGTRAGHGEHGRIRRIPHLRREGRQGQTHLVGGPDAASGRPARDRRRRRPRPDHAAALPAATVVPTLVPNPETGNTTGFLVVEIPESPDSPHMTDFTYSGRSETGRVRLTDSRVERLIIARTQRHQRLPEEMRATATVDPLRGGDRWVSHFYFTAVPTRGWPEMFAHFTSESQARTRLLRRWRWNAKSARQTTTSGHGRRSSAGSPKPAAHRKSAPAGWTHG